MTDFEHERLDVHRAAVEQLTLADTDRLVPYGAAEPTLSDQLPRRCRTLQLADAELERSGRALLLRIVAMLTAMVLKLGDSGSGSGWGSGSG